MSQTIEFFCFDGALVLDVTGPLQVFAFANDVANAKGLPPPYKLLLTSQAGKIITWEGVSLDTELVCSTGMPVDTLIIPGGWGVQDAVRNEGAIDYIRFRAGAARRTASICGGAFFLAETGLLDGRRAVTHWEVVDELRARYPDVTVEEDPIFIQDSGIWTSAGVTAGIDMALAMVQEDLGHQMALAVARRLVVHLRRAGGQSQFNVSLDSNEACERFEKLHTWISKNLQKRLSLQDLANHAQTSVRTLTRQYKAATGKSPLAAIEDIRFSHACRLLEQDANLNQVVKRCGFGTEQTMRRIFNQRIGVTPHDYRKSFMSFERQE